MMTHDGGGVIVKVRRPTALVDSGQGTARGTFPLAVPLKA